MLADSPRDPRAEVQQRASEHARTAQWGKEGSLSGSADGVGTAAALTHLSNTAKHSGER